MSTNLVSPFFKKEFFIFERVSFVFFIALTRPLKGVLELDFRPNAEYIFEKENAVLSVLVLLF